MSCMPPNQYQLYPLHALLGIAGGAAAAYLLIPSVDYYSPGALAGPATALALGLLVGPVTAAFRNPASVLRAESVLAVGLIYWILFDAIQGVHGLWGTTQLSVYRAFISVALFACSIWIGSITAQLTDRSRREIKYPELAANYIFGLVILTFVAGIFLPIYSCQLNPQCIVDAFFVPNDEVPWRKVGFGSFDTVVKYIGYLGYTTLPLAVALLHLERRVSQRVILALILGLILLVFFMQSGSRRKAGMVVAAAGLVWVLIHDRVLLKHLLILGALSVATLFMTEFIVTWRNEGLATAIFSEEDKKERKGIITIDKSLYYMTHAMSVVPERYPFKPVDGPLSALGAPIPRSIWPSKPAQSGGIPLLRFIGERKGPGFSWSCSAVCDFYLYGGYPAIVIGGFIFGLLAHASNRLLLTKASVSSRLIYAFALMSLFIGLRNFRDLTAIGIIVILIWGILNVRRWYTKNLPVPPRDIRTTKKNSSEDSPSGLQEIQP